MRILIFGASGFVGKHLIDHLYATDHTNELHGTTFSDVDPNSIPAFHRQCCQWQAVDTRDPQQVESAIASVKPDHIYHLAGQAFVPVSHERPWETLEINLRGTLNVLQSVRQLRLPTKILVISSAEIYGPAQQLPLTEQSTFIPTSPYSVSKIAQDMLTWQYWLAYQVNTIRIRPFNHIGPGQTARFAASDWAAQIAQAELGLRPPTVQVGTLTAARDFTDVRDVVRAYGLTMQYGHAGEVFNVCTGQAVTMQTILEHLLSLSTIPIRVEVDPARVRPVDIPILYGTYEALHHRTGWTPQISLQDTLRDVLEEWRQHFKAKATT